LSNLKRNGREERVSGTKEQRNKGNNKKEEEG